MPRHSSKRDRDDKHKKDCCYSCYKKSSRRERSDSSVSNSTISTYCKCDKCITENEIKCEKPQILICKQDEREQPVCCDKSLIIIINMK
jgi:hypothetical protein